jgi:hypothetical protein
MKKYILQWKVKSDSNPKVYYTVSLNHNGDFSCTCDEWAEHHDCDHITDVLLTMKPFEKYLRALAMWKKAIMENHIDGIWDELYEIAKNIDLVAAQVTFKIAFGETYKEAKWEELKEMITTLQLPWFPALNMPSAIDFQESEYGFDIEESPLADIYDLFYYGENGKVRFNTAYEEFLFVSKHRGKKYVPILKCLDCGEDDSLEPLVEESKPFMFAMLTPTIAVQIPTNLIKAGR